MPLNISLCQCRDQTIFIFQDTFQFLPKQRRLDTDELDEVKNILTTRPNKKVLQNHIRNKTGKMVTLRDIANQAVKINPKADSFEDIFEGVDATSMLFYFIHSNLSYLRESFYTKNT